MRAPDTIAVAVRKEGVWQLRASSVLSHGVLLCGATVSWIIALNSTHPAHMAGHGLLDVLPASYYLTLAILACGFLLTIGQPRTVPWLLAVYVIALVVVLHLTTVLLYSEPRFAWLYKHLGVTDYISHFGVTDRSLDLYQNWPGLFGITAMLERTSGVSLIAIAPWAEVFFEIAYVAGIVFLLGGVSNDRRVVWSAAWLFVLANWLAQSYFSPQAFAFLLYLVLIAICVRCAPTPCLRPLPFRWTDRLWRKVQQRARGRRSPWVAQSDLPMGARSALVIGAVLYAAIVITHQLSPLICIFAVAAFAATTRRISWWLVAAMILAEVAWVAAAWPLISREYQLLTFSPFERPVAAGGNSIWALPGFSDSTIGARASGAVMVVLAAVGLWRRRRERHFDLPLIAMAAAPALLLVIQPYSGEGLFRVYLFALPWLCFFAATSLVSKLDGSTWRRVLPIATVTVLLGGAWLFADFGREIVNYISPEDVAVERAYERTAPPGAAVLLLAPNAPNRLSYRYANKQVWAGSFSPSLTEDPLFRDRYLGFGDISLIEVKLRELQASAAYVMVTPSQINYVNAFGLLPPGSVRALVDSLRASIDFRLVAQDGEASLFLFAPDAGSSP